MFFLISKIFDLFSSPFTMGMIVTTLGVILGFTRAAGFGRLCAAGGLVLLIAVAYGPVGQFLAVPLEQRFPRPPADMDAPDGIIVLGGTVDEIMSAKRDMTVFAEAADRLTAPIELRRRFPNARLVFTGGTAAVFPLPYSEANAVRRFWQDVGLDHGDVIYEDKARNTYENAIFTRDLIKPREGERWLLITSAIHMPRSVGIFRQAGIPVIPYPVDYRTNGDFWGWRPLRSAPQSIGVVNFAMHEYVGLVAYWLTGKTDALFPGP